MKVVVWAGLTVLRIFYELWTFAYFDRLCKLEKMGDEIKKFSSPLKLLSQSQPNFAEIIVGWSPFKIVTVSTVLYPRWPPLLKIEISSNGQNCSILSQKVPNLNCISIMMSFLTYITGFFMNFELLPILTDYANKKKGGMKLKKILLLWNYCANLNQTLLKWTLGGPLWKLCPSVPSCIQDGRHD